MTPHEGYGVSAAFQSFSWAALVGYPSAAVNSVPGFSPSNGLWFLITVAVGFGLTRYSVMPKHRILLMCNWLVIPLFCIAVLWGCWQINPKAVGDNAGMVLLFSLFTFGGPLWLPLIASVLHLWSCLTVGRSKMPNPSINTDTAR